MEFVGSRSCAPIHTAPKGAVKMMEVSGGRRNPANPDGPRFFPLGAVPIGLSLWGIAIWLLL